MFVCGGLTAVKGFKSDEELREEIRCEHEEILDEAVPDFGKDWEQGSHSAKEQLASDAFVEPDENWFLFAHGSVKDARCGSFMRRKVKKLHGCLRLEKHSHVKLDGVDYSGKVYIKRIFHSCNRPECPSCGISGYAVREARNIERRLLFAYLKLGLVEHIVVSSKRLDWDFGKLKKYVLKYLRSVGVVGGCLIYHHFRYHGKNETFFGEQPNYFVSPHFHVLGFIKGGYGNCRSCRCLKFKTFDKCRGCNGFEGVVRRAYDKADKRGLPPLIIKTKDKRESVGGTAWYELTHCSLRKGVKKQVVVSWFGECSRKRLRIPKGSMPQKEHLCEICNEPLYEVQFLGDYRKLLSMMGAYKDSQGFVLDAKDETGKWLWRVVVKENGSYG